MRMHVALQRPGTPPMVSRNQFTENRLQIHYDPDQYKAVAKDK